MKGRRRADRATRALAALVLVVTAGLLWLGDRSLPVVRAATAWASPGDPGAAFACSFRARTGVPCVGCGGTTAFGHAARWRWAAAAKANTLGTFAGVAAWALLLASAVTLFLGRAAWLRWTGLAVALVSPFVLVSALIGWWIWLPPGLAGL